MSSFFKECHGKILPVLALMSTIVYLLLCFVELDNWYKLIGAVVVYVALYFTIAYTIVFNKEEKSIIQSLNLLKR
jgi:hypothetical protein